MRPWHDTERVRAGGRRVAGGGFTLLELLVSMTIILLMVALLGRLLGQATDLWNRGEGNKERLQNVRATTEFIGNELGAALLPVNRTDVNNLQMVVNPPGISAAYKNHDAVFWQAPLATERSLGDVAEIGYFVQWDTSVPSNPRAQLRRFFANPSQASAGASKPILNPSYLIYKEPTAWLSDAVIKTVALGDQSSASPYQGLFADNVIGLWVQCLDPSGAVITKNAKGDSLASGNGFLFDSRLGYQYKDTSQNSPVTVTKAACALPAAVELSLVMIDSKTAARMTPDHRTRIEALAASPVVSNGDTFVSQALATDGLRAVNKGMHSYNVRIFLQNSK